MFNKNSRPLSKDFLGEMERVSRGDGVMKKQLRIMLLLLLSGIIAHAMDKPSLLKTSAQRYNPFGKLATHNAPPLNDEQLAQMVKRGDYDVLQQELGRGLNAQYVFETGEFKGKSLIQAVFGNSVVNRNQIAARLLKHGANPQDLNEFIKNAVKAYSSETVEWLLDHGAKDDTAYEVVALIERSAQGLKKEQLQKIKVLLEPVKVRRETKLPVFVLEPIKKQITTTDLYTVLGATEEQKLFKAVLAGDVNKLYEYLEMGVSPNFVFTTGAAGKSLLQVGVTQTLNNQEKIADLLIKYGADSQALSDGLIFAVERFDKPKVEWLLAKGAPVTAQLKQKIQELEKNNTHPVKQKKLAEIKTLVEKQRIPTVPVVKQFNKPLPPVPSKKPAAVETVKNLNEIDDKK